MDADKLLKLAEKFEKMAQTPPPAKKPTPSGVLNVAKQTIKGIIAHPSVIPQAIDQVWHNFFNTIDWLRLSNAQQQEIKRKIMIAKMKQTEDMKRTFQEMEYEVGKETTLKNVQEE